MRDNADAATRLSMLLSLSALVGLLSGAVLFLFSRADIEFERPTIEVTAWPPYLDGTPRSLGFTARDSGSGVRLVAVDLLLEGKESRLATIRPEKNAKVFSGFFSLSVADKDFKDGSGLLRVKVLDRSVWRRTSLVERSVAIDLDAPNVELFSSPTEVRYGDAGLVLYRASDANLTSSGIMIAGRAFCAGFPAGLVDGELDNSGLLAALLAFSPNPANRIEIFAKDVAGHISSMELPVAFVGSNTKEQRVLKDMITEGGFVRLVGSVAQDVLASEFGQHRQSIAALRQKLTENGSRKIAIDLASYLVNHIRPAELELIRSKLDSIAQTQRKWAGKMTLAPVGMRGRFGDKMIINDAKGDLVSWRSDGEVLDTLGNDKSVVAPYAGKVVFAGRLATLGEVLLIDHGAGLATLFYSLGQREVFEGAVLTQGQTLASVGSSGLQTSKALRMLLLVNGSPIDPAPWREGDVFGSNLQPALNGIKSLLGIESNRPE